MKSINAETSTVGISRPTGPRKPIFGMPKTDDNYYSNTHTQQKIKEDRGDNPGRKVGSIISWKDNK